MLEGMPAADLMASPLWAMYAKKYPDMAAHDRHGFIQSVASIEPYSPWAARTTPAEQPGGKLSRYRHRSRWHYPGVDRFYWVYVPAQYQPSVPAALMVLQDGARYLGPELNAVQAMDRLIHSGIMPVTIAVFVQPGEQGPGSPLYGGTDNRSLEYDNVNARYANFLIEELLPEAVGRYNVDPDATAHAICGFSSGGLCAFNAAWHRPDMFSKVVSHCGSFVDIRGGHQCADMVRQEAVKPLRVFLQTGSGDLDISFGKWQSASQELAQALTSRAYDMCLTEGSGGHSLKHGGAIFADTMGWLWRDKK